MIAKAQRIELMSAFHPELSLDWLARIDFGE
jgi:hypothetical protein